MATLDHRPKHKPSPKHTLDEVLKSLQDLIRNDLIDSGAAPGADSTAGAQSNQRHTDSPRSHPGARGDVRRPPGMAEGRAMQEQLPGRSSAGTRGTSVGAEGDVPGRTHAATRSVAGRAARARSNDKSSTVDNVLDSLRELIVQELADAQRSSSTQIPHQSVSRPKSDSEADSEIPVATAARRMPNQETKSATQTESFRTPRQRDDQAEFSFRDVQGRSSAGARGTSVRAEGDVQRPPGMAEGRAMQEQLPGRTSAGMRGADNDTPLPASKRSVRTGEFQQKGRSTSKKDSTAVPADGFDYEYIDLDAPAERSPGDTNGAGGRAPNIGSGFEEHIAPPLPDDVKTDSPLRGSAAKTIGKTLEVAEWDDIPVLDEVAAHPDDDSTEHDIDDPQFAPGAGTPKPDRVREIAIKVVAKLNIELRKCGERGLEARTVDRLNFLLREALGPRTTKQTKKPNR